MNVQVICPKHGKQRCVEVFKDQEFTCWVCELCYPTFKYEDTNSQKSKKSKTKKTDPVSDVD